MREPGSGTWWDGVWWIVLFVLVAILLAMFGYSV